MTLIRTALAAVSICAPAVSLAQNAPTFQLVDIGYTASNLTLRWAQSPAKPIAGGCPIAGPNLSYYTAGTPAGHMLVGWTTTAQGYAHAAVCAVSGYYSDLGVLYGGPNSYAENISEYSGAIVGWSQTDLTPVPQEAGQIVTLAFISNGSGMTPLLSAMNDPHYSSKANAVNDAGEVVGAGQMLFTSGPYAGQVSDRAMLWESGQVFNLQFRLTGNPGVTLTSATMIDCNGNIAEYGHLTGDDSPYDVREYLLLRVNPTSQCPSSGPTPEG